MPCYNLHQFAGHEYMYTKELQTALLNQAEDYEPVIYARTDVTSDIINEIGCKPYYSKVIYRQDNNFLKKIFALIKREYHWYLQNKKLLENLSDEAVIFVHTFSIYSTWQWIFLNRYVNQKNHKLKLVFRYSKKLLPKYLHWLHSKICKKVGEVVIADLFTDSEELRLEYEAHCARSFTVLPVMAETNVVAKNEALAKAQPDKFILTYLGAARHDKGFHLLPAVVEHLCQSTPNAFFTIQASVPGTAYLEAECEQALVDLHNLKQQFPSRITLITEPVDQKQYRRLVQEASILLLPYIGTSYKTQTSGILIEATTNGIPCIAPSQTWLSVQLDKTRGGITFEANNNKTLINAIDELLERYDEYLSNAVEHMDNEKLNHGAKAQLDCILAQPHDNR